LSGKGEYKTPIVLNILILVGLFTLLIAFYGFYRAEVNDAIYTSVMNETKERLRNTVLSYIDMIEREGKLHERDNKKRIEEEVKNAWAIANSLYLFCKREGCSKEKTKKLIEAALKNYRFSSGTGTIFIDTLGGKMLVSPGSPSLQGREIWNLKDDSGKPIHKAFEQAARYSANGGGFVSYKLNGVKKVAYVKYFEPFGWIIGGEIDERHLKDQIREHILAVGTAFQAAVFDPEKIRKFEIFQGLTDEELKRGVFVRTDDDFYYLKYSPQWNWIISSYATNGEILRKVYELKEQFLSKADKIIFLASVLTSGILGVSLVVITRYNRKLTETVKELKKKKRELVRLMRHLKVVAFKDDTTGLSNRKKLFQDLKKLESVRSIHFALVNIRNFKDLNELLGLEEGDKLLRRFAKVLKREVKKLCKKCLVYRIRGDKFGILACNMTDAQFLELIQKITKKIESYEFEVKDLKLKLDVVTGISKNRKNLLIEAEIAEEAAKKRGMDIYVFDDELQKIFDKLKENLRIAAILKEAVAKDGVVPFFQPIVDLSDGSIFEYEVLMRVKTGNGEIITPGQFLEVAKKIAIYEKLSRALIEKAFQISAETGARISVNLSTEDLASKNTIQWIVNSLQKYNLKDKVCFEIVETEAFSDLKVLEEFYHKIKELGALLAIDDFGSGYSNYEYLATVKPDIVKIDGSLITKILKSEDVEKLVRHIVAFSKDLGIKTAAEFISSEEIYRKVKELGIDYGQGYFFGRPTPNILEVESD
jgi:diguanylate cyclase (GGDEF)-like protein